MRHLLLFVVASATAGVFATPSVAEPPGSFAAPGLRVTPPIIYFGSVAQGETRERTVTVENIGTAPVVIDGIGVPFPSVPITFSFTPEECAAPLLQPGASCTVTLIAEPDAATNPGVYEAAFIMTTIGGAEIVHVPLILIVRSAS